MEPKTETFNSAKNVYQTTESDDRTKTNYAIEMSDTSKSIGKITS